MGKNFMTYFVVAQLGLYYCKIILEIDYMLETTILKKKIKYNILFKNSNLFIFSKIKNLLDLNLLKIDNNDINSKNYCINTFVQSAGNFKGSSETIRQISKKKSYNSYIAGIIDCKGIYDIKKIKNQLILKAIKIKLLIKDKKILTFIQNNLHMGKIINKDPYVLLIISKNEDMKKLINSINGLINFNLDSFKFACLYYNIKYIESDKIIKLNNSYLAGIIDTNGSIIYNYKKNRIECNIKFNKNIYTSKLNFNNILDIKPYINNNLIIYKYQTKKSINILYDYIMKYKLYSDIKNYRLCQYKSFMKINYLQNYPFNSLEFILYSKYIYK